MNPEYDWQFYCPTCGYREVQRLTNTAAHTINAMLAQGRLGTGHGTRQGALDCGTLRLEPCRA